jgi:hypothetical protein
MKENININNALIAEFMGWKKHPKHNDCMINKNKDRILPYWCEYNMEIPLNELNYSQSYDWLMPVIKKIKSFGHSNKPNSIEFLSWYMNMDYIIIEFDINKIYLACVEYIKWYNKNKLKS